MAIYQGRKLHIKDTKTNTVYDCNIYSAESEATPKAVKGTAIAGATMTVKHNNVVGYIGLVPKSDSYSTYRTPLSYKKNNIEYWVQTAVVNSYKVTIAATSNQKIRFTAGGVTTEVTTAAKTVYVDEGTAYTCEVIANTGYTAGSLSGASASGYVTANMNINATAAEQNDYVVKVVVPTGAIIKLGDAPYSAGTHNPTKNYGDQFSITATPTNSAQYSVTNLTVNGAPFTSGNTYTMPASNIEITCDATIGMYTITLIQGTGTTLEVKNGSTSVANNSTVAYGTELSYEAKAKTGYENPDVTVGG